MLPLPRRPKSTGSRTTIEVSLPYSLLDLCRNFALVVWRDDLIRRPRPNVFDHDRLAQAPRIRHRCGERQGLSILGSRIAFDHMQLIAVFALPRRSAGQNTGSLNDERAAFPMTDRISQPA